MCMIFSDKFGRLDLPIFVPHFLQLNNPVQGKSVNHITTRRFAPIEDSKSADSLDPHEVELTMRLERGEFRSRPSFPAVTKKVVMG